MENYENIFKCLLCRMCETECRAGVHIAENIRALRTYINRDVHRITRS
jgi:Fe-S oxidoreductase